MNEVFEYRRTPGKGVVWLSAIYVVILITVVSLTNASHLEPLVWGLGGAVFLWMALPRAVSGIRVDRNYLILAAWRNPRIIALDDIAYLRATEASAETNIAIVYKDGTEEGTFAGDMPDIDVLVSVMAERGIPVRDMY